jgi:hypothetical protein
MQSLFLPDELSDAGLLTGSVINSIGFHVAASSGLNFVISTHFSRYNLNHFVVCSHLGLDRSSFGKFDRCIFVGTKIIQTNDFQLREDNHCRWWPNVAQLQRIADC